jgi:hypothetical protein
MTCQRCDSMWGEEATVRIRTEMLDIEVCDKCAKEARRLGLLTERLSRNGEIVQDPVEPSYATGRMYACETFPLLDDSKR